MIVSNTTFCGVLHKMLMVPGFVICCMYICDRLFPHRQLSTCLRLSFGDSLVCQFDYYLIFILCFILKGRLQRHNSTQLDVELSTRSHREQLSPISSERRDPVDSVCRSWRHIWRVLTSLPGDGILEWKIWRKVNRIIEKDMPVYITYRPKPSATV